MNPERDDPENERNPFHTFPTENSGQHRDDESLSPENQLEWVQGTSIPTTMGGVLVNFFCCALIALLVISLFMMQKKKSQEPAAKPSPFAELSELSLQAKLVLGIKTLVENNPTLEEPQQDEEIPFGAFGSVRIRQAGSVIISELKSMEDALVVLELLKATAKDTGYSFSEEEKETTRILEKLYRRDPSALSPAESEHLQKELLWFADLALHPETDGQQDPTRKKIMTRAESTLLTVAGMALVGMMCLLLGLVGGIYMLLLYSSGRLLIRTRMVSGESSIFLEVFTVWLVCFVLFGMVVGLIAPTTNPLVANCFVFLSSLGTGLMWALLRGKFSERIRQDIGYQGNFLKEIPAAIWCYLCTLPLVVTGLLLSTYLVTRYGGESESTLSATGPTHPILEWVMQGNTPTIALVFFVACFCAPLVEETMFRGCLYRALKDNSYFLGHFLSSLFAAVVNGILFAAIHPQGLFFIPALCSIGVGFSIAREWRGTLWTPMIMHALHNGILTATLVFILAS